MQFILIQTSYWKTNWRWGKKIKHWLFSCKTGKSSWVRCNSSITWLSHVRETVKSYPPVSMISLFYNHTGSRFFTSQNMHSIFFFFSVKSWKQIVNKSSFLRSCLLISGFVEYWKDETFSLQHVYDTCKKKQTCSCRITSLDHKITNNTMKFYSIVISSSCKLCKISACTWCMFPVQFKYNRSSTEK